VEQEPWPCMGGAHPPPAAKPPAPQNIAQSWLGAPPCTGAREQGGPGLSPPREPALWRLCPPPSTQPSPAAAAEPGQTPCYWNSASSSCLDRVITGYYTDHLHGHLQVISITLSYLSAHFLPHNICLIRLLCSLSMLQ